MVSVFHPPFNKVQFINSYVLYLIKAGSGSIEVDFHNYTNWQEKALYLSPGQYIKFLSDDFEVFSVSFPDIETFDSKEFRVLFKHLLSLGYIDLNRCQECKRFLSEGALATPGQHILDISSNQWFWQNPFQASKDEYHIIFDLKDSLDNQYEQAINSHQLVRTLDHYGLNVGKLVKDKLGISIRSLLSNKRTLESKRKIAFTNKSIQEVAYETGFKDPGYFNRLFKRVTGKTPKEYRKEFDYTERDTFINDIMELLRQYHGSHHQLEFYAQKMHMSVPTLSQKVREKLNTTLGKLIRAEIIITAKNLLKQNLSIKETAVALGFEEPNHFSTFFKYYSGLTPSEYQQS